jgi:hypothetical protein
VNCSGSPTVHASAKSKIQNPKSVNPKSVNPNPLTPL